MNMLLKLSRREREGGKYSMSYWTPTMTERPSPSDGDNRYLPLHIQRWINLCSTPESQLCTEQAVNWALMPSGQKGLIYQNLLQEWSL